MQALLTHYSVERAGSKGQSHGIAFTPFHSRAQGTGEREHIAVEVQPDDLLHLPATPPAGRLCRATCHIEYALTGFQHHKIEKRWYP